MLHGPPDGDKGNPQKAAPGRHNPGGTTMRYEVISADCHVDLCWLPPDLFTSQASSALRERMPYVADGPDRADVEDEEAAPTSVT